MGHPYFYVGLEKQIPRGLKSARNDIIIKGGCGTTKSRALIQNKPFKQIHGTTLTAQEVRCW